MDQGEDISTSYIGNYNPPLRNTSGITPPPSEGHFGTNRIIRKIRVKEKLRQWGDVQSNLEFDIFVSYDSVNLKDHRHF